MISMGTPKTTLNLLKTSRLSITSNKLPLLLLQSKRSLYRLTLSLNQSMFNSTKTKMSHATSRIWDQTVTSRIQICLELQLLWALSLQVLFHLTWAACFPKDHTMRASEMTLIAYWKWIPALLRLRMKLDLKEWGPSSSQSLLICERN